MAGIMTTRGQIDDSLLIKRQDITLVETDDYKAVATATEYCLHDCIGNAHTTDIRDAEAFFCQFHIHRSVHVDVLKMVGMQPQIFDPRDPIETSNL